MPDSPRSFVRSGRGLPQFAAATVAVMVAVILWGAVVRITSSGGGCGSHWPLCNGEFFPLHPRLATVIEFTHRATTGLCSTLALAVLAWAFLARNTSLRARFAAVVSVVLLIVEALLGRALVVHGYVENNVSDARSVMQCVHFTNTMALLAAFTLTWWWLRPQSVIDAVPVARSHQFLAVASAALAMVAGATGSVAALADTLFPAATLRSALAQDFATTAPLLVRMRWIHPAATMLLSLCILLLWWGKRTRETRAVMMLLASQIVIGSLDVLLLAPAWLQIVHLLSADIFWMAVVVCTAQIVGAAAAYGAKRPNNRPAVALRPTTTSR